MEFTETSVLPYNLQKRYELDSSPTCVEIVSHVRRDVTGDPYSNTVQTLHLLE